MPSGRSTSENKGGLRPPTNGLRVQTSRAVRTDDRHHRIIRLEQQMLETSEHETTNCVHIEHRTSNLPDFCEALPRAAAMSPYRIGLCLTTLGWSERELARRTGRHQTEVRRWMLGAAMIDPSVAEWLAELEQFFREHPAPRLRPMLRSPVRENHHDQHGYQRSNQAECAHTTVT